MILPQEIQPVGIRQGQIQESFDYIIAFQCLQAIYQQFAQIFSDLLWSTQFVSGQGKYNDGKIAFEILAGFLYRENSGIDFELVMIFDSRCCRLLYFFE